MTISSTLTWESEIAEGARKDASALRALKKALDATGQSLSVTSTAPLAASLGAVGNAAAIAQVKIAELAAATARDGSAAKNAAQQNAALAKVVLAQAKGSQDRQRLEMQAQAKLAQIAAKGAADQERIANQHAARMRELGAKETADKKKKLSEEEKLAKKISEFDAAKYKALQNQKDKLRDLQKKAVGRPEEPAKSGGGIDVAGVAMQAAHGNVLDATISAVGALGPYGKAAAVLMTAAKTVGGMVYEVYQQAISVILGLGQTGIGMAISATSAHESLVGSLESLGKTHTASEALYHKIVAMSIATGRDKTLLAAEFKRLAAVGFKDEQIPAIAKMLADTSAIKGEGKANQLEKLFTKIQAKNALDPRVVTALTNQGFSQKELYATLAKALHKSENDIPGLIKAGKINAATAEAAIAKVVEKQLGPATERQANTILALITRIKIAAEELFDLNESSVAPLKKFLANVIKLLSSDYGERLKAAVNNLFGAVFGTAFDDLNSKAGQFKMASMFQGVTNAVNQTAAAVRTLRPQVQALIALMNQLSKDGTLKGFVDVGRMAAKEKLGGLQDETRATKGKADLARKGVDWESLIDPRKSFFKQFTETSETAQHIKRALSGSDDQATDKKQGPKKGPAPANTNALLPTFATDDAQADISDQGSLIGMALNLGMVQGIEANQDAAIAAAGLTAEQIIARVRAVLKTHSPSEEFSDIAKDSVAGMAQGFDKHGGKSADAAGRMAMGALRFGKAGASKSGAAASGGGNVYNISVVAYGSGAQDIGNVVREEMMAVMRAQSEAA